MFVKGGKNLTLDDEDHKQKNGSMIGGSRPATPSYQAPIPIAIAPSSTMSTSSETNMVTYASTINNQLQSALANTLGQPVQINSASLQVSTNGAASILNSLSGT